MSAPERDLPELLAFAAWVNCAPENLPGSYKQHTCEATMTAWRRVVGALHSPEALAASPEVQALIAAAETRGMDRAAEIAESIRIRIANGPMPEGARFDYEQAIRAEAAALRSFKKGE